MKQFKFFSSFPSFLFSLLLLLVGFVHSQATFTAGYGNMVTINKTWGDTIRIDTLKIKQKQSGAFVVDSTTPINVALQQGGRSPNYDRVSLLFRAKNATTTLDSAQITVGVGYCWGAFCAAENSIIDSSKVITQKVKSTIDTVNKALIFVPPRDATSMNLYIHTAPGLCATCRLLIIPNRVYSN